MHREVPGSEDMAVARVLGEVPEEVTQDRDRNSVKDVGLRAEARAFQAGRTACAKPEAGSGQGLDKGWVPCQSERREAQKMSHIA